MSVAFSTQSFPSEGGVATGQVSASAPGCGWSFEPPSWVTVVPASGTGSSTVTATVAPTIDARSGQLLFGVQPIVLTQAASPEAANLGVSIANCRVTARRGMTTPGACSVVPRHGRNPDSTGITVTADLRVFGRAADYGLVYVTGSGGAWDLDVPVPADFPSATVPITFRVADAQGRSATTVVSLVIQ